MKKIAVLGAGNAGHAVSGSLALQGHEVRLFEMPAYAAKIETMLDNPTMKVYYSRTDVTKMARLALVTTDISKAVQGAEIILVTVPSFAHRPMAAALAPVLSTGQVVILLPGATGGALEFRRELSKWGVETKIKLGETATLPYATRITGPGQVDIRHTVNLLWYSALPAVDTPETLELFRTLYEQAEPLDTVLDIALNNGNPISHSTAVVLNAGRIEYAKGEYYNYAEGITPSVARVIELVDAERVAVAEALGVLAMSSQERLVKLGYTEARPTLYEQIRTSFSFMRSKGPKDLQARYLTEDVPYGLVTWASLGRQLKVDTPNMNAIIQLACALLNENYWVTGRTVESLGLAGMTAREMKRFVTVGA